jgi:RNA polymerase sigma-70 factor (ECF subfamily)
MTNTTLDLDLEAHRVALTGYCYRMLGSAADAEDAVQETMIRAWRNLDRFEGRSSVKTWLHSIATNVCFDQLGGKQRRVRPMDMGPSARQPTEPGDMLPEATWLTPVPDGAVVPDDGDPAEVAIARDTIRLAFVAALQHLPPKQRAVLILREVLRWRAEEVATLLDTTVQSVNSALQRARATLADRGLDAGAQSPRVDGDDEELLSRYVDAFERYDIDALVLLLRDDARLSMPPYALWIVGREEIAAWHLGPGHGCRGSRLVPTIANGAPAFGQYRDGGKTPWALQVLEIEDGRVIGLNAFLDTDTLFPLFGLPPSL